MYGMPILVDWYYLDVHSRLSTDEYQWAAPSLVGHYYFLKLQSLFQSFISPFPYLHYFYYQFILFSLQLRCVYITQFSLLCLLFTQRFAFLAVDSYNLLSLFWVHLSCTDNDFVWVLPFLCIHSTNIIEYVQWPPFWKSWVWGDFFFFLIS